MLSHLFVKPRLSLPRLFLILFVMLLGSDRVFAQAPGKLSDCNRYEIRQSAMLIKCQGGGTVRIQPVGEQVVQVWVSPDDSLQRSNSSFAVVRDSLGLKPRLRVSDKGTHWNIAAGKLYLKVNKSPFTINYYDDHGRLLGGDKDRAAYSWTGSEWTWKRGIGKSEKILGLGEKAGPVVRNGRSFTMWNSDQPCYSDKEDPLYKSIPFYLSTRNYGIFLDNTYKTHFDVGDTHSGVLNVHSAGGPLIYYVIGGNDLKAVMSRYIKLTGKPMLPPKWAFGYAQSRGFYTNEKLARSAAHMLRAHRIPADIIYQDIGWVDQLQNFEWNPDRYQDPQGMLKDLQQEGFKVIVSQDPIISKRNKKQWQEAADKNLLVLDRRTGKPYNMPWPWGGPGGLVDFTKPAAADYWGKLQQKVVDQGVDGFWTDMGEPAWSNLDAPDRLFMKHQAGPHAEIHNVYGHTWDRLVTAQWRKRNGNRRIFQMTRSAFAGMQRFTFGWSGDSGCQEDVLQDWNRLADQVRVAQSAGLGGIMFWSSDISGYCGDITDYKAFAPIYVRWMQFGMFNTLSRVHHNGNQAVEPWQFGPEIEDMVRKAVERRYQLFPYIYTYARRSYDKGLPVIRPMELEFPNDPNALKADLQFMFGREMLVAPVVSDTTIRRLYLPKGNWIDFNRPNRKVEGGRWITQKAPLGETPIWVREGSIIPTMPVMQYIHEKPDYPVILEMYPAGDPGDEAGFELYEDDGLTYDYEKNRGSRTSFAIETTARGWDIKVADRESHGYEPPSPRSLVFKVHLPVGKEISKVEYLEGEKTRPLNREGLTEVMDYRADLAGWAIQQADHILYVRIPDTGKKRVIRVENGD